MRPARGLFPEQEAMLMTERATTLAHLVQLHALLLKCSLDRCPFVLAKFLRRCFALPARDAVPYGRSLFDRHPSPDAFLWNTVLRAYLRDQQPGESLRLVRQMQLRGTAEVDSFGLSLGVQACARCRDRLSGGSLHGRAVKHGFGSDVFVQTALLEMYGEVRDVANARRVFDEMPERDLVAHNVMLAEYVACGEIKAARRLFDEMPEKDLVSWNTMIHGFAACGDLSAARDAFERSHGKDLVSWSSMISAYAQNKQPEEALGLFREMQLAGVVPDRLTMVSLLSACGDLGALGTGKTIHEYIERNGLEVDLKLGTALLDMYAKCGAIDISSNIFEAMVEKDVFAWSAMISGLANHGRAERALGLFSRMLAENVEPNDGTFVGVLVACSHAGLVSRGRACFASMADAHGIRPKIEHYACMVDLLGRAGRLEEARRVIAGMPYEPDAVVWRALLAACRNHKHLELAEEAALRLLRLEPREEGHYVLYANALSRAGRWEGVAGVRRTMRAEGIRKAPGRSSIEVGGAVHEFVAGDRSHPESGRVYEMLAEMNDRLTAAGLEPTTWLVLQDVDRQTEERMSCTPTPTPSFYKNKS